MSTFDGGSGSYSGIPPARVSGVEVQRKVPALPEPAVKMPEEIPDIMRRYLLWESEWSGTFPEFLVFRWLEKKNLSPNADFYFQSSRMGGRQLWGGCVVDFDFPSERLAWRIQGEFFHVGNPAKEASDIMQKMSLSTKGYIVVDIYAQDVLERLDWVLTHAINGEQARSLHEGGS